MRVTNQRLSRPTASTKQIRKNEEEKDKAYFTGEDAEPRIFPAWGLQTVGVAAGGGDQPRVSQNHHFKMPE